MHTYGTYQTFQYQTAPITSIKPYLNLMLKALFVVLVVLSAIVVALALVQVVMIAATWFVANIVNISIVSAVFICALGVKP